MSDVGDMDLKVFPTLFNAFFATPQIFATADSRYSAARGFAAGLKANKSGVGGVAIPTSTMN